MAKQHLSEYSSTEALNIIAWGSPLALDSFDTRQGYKVIHKFGHNLDINSSYETLWSVGGNYSYLSSATTLKISSADANDDDGDTGARTVLVQGLDTNYNEIEETVTLNGQTAVNTSNESGFRFDL